MDKNWSEKNKEIQKLLSKKATFKDAVEKLVSFRVEMFDQITHIVRNYPDDAFYQMPFAGVKGLHNSTLAFSIWHTFRIEDIVVHEMITGDTQIFFTDGFQKSIRSPIITTANELSDSETVEFSKQLDIKELYHYAQKVMESTNLILRNLEYPDLKRKFGNEMIEKLQATGCVSDDKEASWLIEYWCGKNVCGLIKMPLSRHWIMHIEAMRRIIQKLEKN